MEKIFYGIFDCDMYKGVDNLDDDEVLELMGYEDEEEFKEENGEDREIKSYFIEEFNFNFRDIIEEYGLTILKEEDISYYERGCLFSKIRYKVKGLKEDMYKVNNLWFVVNSELINVDELVKNMRY